MQTEAVSTIETPPDECGPSPIDAVEELDTLRKRLQLCVMLASDCVRESENEVEAQENLAGLLLEQVERVERNEEVVVPTLNEKTRQEAEAWLRANPLTSEDEGSSLETT